MTEFHITPYRGDHFSGVKALWQEAFPDDPPWNAAEIAIPAKIVVQPDLFVVALKGDQVIGSVMAGYDGHRGWISRIAVLSSCARQGIGTALMHEAEARLLSIGCRKINLQVRSTNAAVVAFYERLGYAIEERTSMAKRVFDLPPRS